MNENVSLSMLGQAGGHGFFNRLQCKVCREDERGDGILVDGNNYYHAHCWSFNRLIARMDELEARLKKLEF